MTCTHYTENLLYLIFMGVGSVWTRVCSYNVAIIYISNAVIKAYR